MAKVGEYGTTDQMIGYEQTTRDGILNQFKTLLPGEDANYADYSLLVSGVVLAIATKNSNLSMKSYEIASNGKSIIIDGVTNQIVSDTNTVKSFFRSFSSAGVATAVGFVAGSNPAGIAVGFFAGNAAGSWYVDSVFDPIFGASVGRAEGLAINDNVKVILFTNSTFENALASNWIGSNPKTSFRVSKSEQEFLTIKTRDVTIDYTKSENSYEFKTDVTIIKKTIFS